MNGWQLTLAASLVTQAAVTLVMWFRVRRRAAGVWGDLPRPMRLAIGWSWLAVALPVSEAAMLWGAGFWGIC